MSCTLLLGGLCYWEDDPNFFKNDCDLGIILALAVFRAEYLLFDRLNCAQCRHVLGLQHPIATYCRLYQHNDLKHGD